MENVTSQQRLSRLRTALKALLVHEQFSLPQLKDSLPEENPAYVTQMVHQLQKEGHLVGNDGLYCWTCEPENFPAESWLKAQVHGTQLPQTPAEDRPRERLLAQGPGALRTAELLAILIRSGRKGESALQAGEKIAARYKDQLHRLVDAGRGELKDIAGAVGETAYCQIMAGIELGRRVARAFGEQGGRPQRITCSEDALAFCRRHFERLASDAASEEFHIVTLDAQYQVIGAHRISVGSLDRSLVHPREVFRPAIKDAAKAILLVHNHPSGNPTPSPEDLTVTSRLEDAGQTLGIKILDHIVVGRLGASSVQETRAKAR
jgi:DNA repair protein RadC